MIMQNIVVIPNELKDNDLKYTKYVISELAKRGKTVFLNEKFRHYFSDSEQVDAEFSNNDYVLTKADCAVVLGGDGTILDIASYAAQNELPVVGINLGNLGFLAQAEKDEADFFDKLLNEDFHIDECMMLDVEVMTGNEKIAYASVLNDVVVKPLACDGMISVSAEVNNTDMGRYLADGIITATAVGSTAYSLSAGGAVLHPTLDAMIITPICPHTLKARSTVISGNAEIVLRAAPRRKDTHIAVLADGRLLHTLETNEVIKIKRSDKKIRLIKLNGRNFFDILREKLSDR